MGFCGIHFKSKFKERAQDIDSQNKLEKYICNITHLAMPNDLMHTIHTLRRAHA